MTRSIICLTVAVLWTFSQASAQSDSMKVAIIKADDIRRITPKWDRFFTISRKKEVKVSAGVICSTLSGDKDDYFDWLRDLNTSGCVEFWNHGWDHKRWMTEEGVKISEFSGSGYEHQKKHFDDSQRIMKSVLGTTPIAFGSPYNAVDTDTVKIMNEDPDIRLFFCYRADGLINKVLAPMRLRGEHDGTGKPNFAKFKAAYMEKKDVSFSAIQFHPNSFDEEHFTEYAKILDFLIAEGWTFMLPAEYVSMVE